jgi:hypothetical protein
VHGGLLQTGVFLQAFLAVLFEKGFVFVVFESGEFVEGFIFETVFVFALAGGEDGFFDYGVGVGWFFGDYAVLAEDVVPGECRLKY